MIRKDNRAYIGSITAYPYEDTDTSASEVIEFLSENTDVEIFINSGGGDVFEAMQIYAELRRHSERHSVKVYVDGLSASASSYLMFGGTELIVPANATIMMHKPTSAIWGNAEEMRTTADALDVIQNNIESIYLANSKSLSSVQIHHLVNATTWMSGVDFAEKFRCTLASDLGAEKTTENKVLNDFKDKIDRETKMQEKLDNFLKNQQKNEENPSKDDDFWNFSHKIVY